MWECTQIDETMLIAIYNVIQTKSNAIQDSILELFILKIKNFEPSKLTSRELDFVYQLGKGAIASSQARQFAIDVLWQIAFLEKPGYNKDFLKPARKNCFDLLRTKDRDCYEAYILRALDIIEKKNGASVQALKMFKKLIDLIPRHIYTHNYGSYGSQAPPAKNLSTCLKDLCVNFKIIEKILEDLQNYLLGQSLDEGFDNKKCIWQRFKTILYILNNADERALL